MKTGRNDPCPCGSGKKYKKCCLEKDLKRNASIPLRGVSPKRREDDFSSTAPAPLPSYSVTPPPLPQPPPPLPPRERTPQDELWDRFEAAPYEEQIQLFQNALDDTELMDKELASEMLFSLEPKMLKAGQRERMEELVEPARQRRPEVYASIVPYFAELRIVTALLANRPDEVRRLGLELAELGHNAVEMYHRVLDVLAYHGQLAVLVEMLRVSWPRLKEADLFEWALNDYANTGCLYEMFTEADRQPAASTPPSALRERLLYYLPEPHEDYLENSWNRLTGQSHQDWKLSDFAFSKRPQERDRYDDEEDDEEDEPKPWHDPARGRLWDLSLDFLAEIHREGTVSWTRGELGRKNLMSYLLERFDGSLEPRPDPFEKGPRRKPKASKPPVNALCPDRETLDRFLVSFLRPLQMRSHVVAATFEMVPAWLRFLEARKLLSAELRQETLQKLQPMRSPLAKLWEKDRFDPTLPQGLLHAWEGAK